MDNVGKEERTNMKKTAKINKPVQVSAEEKPVVKSYILAALISISVPFFGLFHEWCAIAFSAIIAVWLVVDALCVGKTVIYRNFTTLAVAVLVFSYLVAALYATDRGMALVGFLKFLPVLLFYIAATNSPGFMAAFTKVFPLFAVGLTAVTALMMIIPPLHDSVTFQNRLHGLTQYPNAFAAVLLAAEIMILGFRRMPVRIIGAVVLAGGIFLTGSRTIIVLFALSNLFLLIRAFRKHKKAMLITAGAAVVLVAGSFALGAVGVSPFDRLLRINFGESTFWFRLIYLGDALPFSLKHPLGIGYLGYSFMEKSFQSMPYYVRFVHNDLMQMILDVGWIPALIFSIAAVRTVFSGKRPILIRTAAAVILLHSLFDFDLQFISVFLILTACMADTTGKTFVIKKRPFTAAALGVIAAVSVYFSTALALSHFGRLEESIRMYPLNTECRVKIMSETKDADALEKCADEVISMNDSISEAYASKAASAFMKGDFDSFILNMRKALDRAPFEYTLHEQYCRLLIQGVEYYEKAGDEASASVCRKEISSTVARYKKTVAGVNPLYKNTVKAPVFDFPDDIMNYASSGSH